MSYVDQICSKIKFPFSPLPQQREKIDWHIDECIDHIGLYWDMGSGKTFSSTILNMVYREQIGAQVIQIVPPILLKQWARWLSKCGISHKVYTGLPEKRKKIELDRNTAYFVMSPGVLKADFERVYDAFSARKIMVCVDEATSVKNYESAVFRAVLQLQSGQGIHLMTGSPLSTPKDAYSYIKLISPHIYRSYKHFENIHAVDKDFFKTVTEWGNLDRLKENLAQRSSFVATPEIHPDMPRANIDPIPYSLAPAHATLYKTLVEKQLLMFDDGSVIDASTPGKLRHALQQVVLNYGYFAQQEGLIPQGFEILDGMLSELGQKKLVIFANYRRSVQAIVDYLKSKGIDCVQVNGDVSEVQKGDAIERFIEVPTCRAIVMNPTAGGVGVDGLQWVCNHMLFMEVPSLGRIFWQAVKRLERPGQKYITDVRIATALGTIQVYANSQLVENDGLINEVVPSLNDLRAQLLGKI